MAEFLFLLSGTNDDVPRVFQLAEIINLNKARKARARAEAKSDAVANRASHGRTRAEKDAAEARKARRDQVLDGARIERPDEDEPA
ncbi:DUF4169 family protein [Brevundimonas sp.]|jgi:hypothetical protein|uniref:DUF4169 family protein n=1 Tax=Brevundimonas sp. TaxID=1871086 RepID=UPI002D1FBABE|nr:DUF4169 family protein [Brevundimonas sp.]